MVRGNLSCCALFIHMEIIFRHHININMNILDIIFILQILFIVSPDNNKWKYKDPHTEYEEYHTFI